MIPKEKPINFLDASDYENSPCEDTRWIESCKSLNRRPLLWMIVVAFLMFFLCCLIRDVLVTETIFFYKSDREILVKEIIFKVCPSLLVAYLATLISFYWNHDALYGRKWNFCVTQFYKLAERDYDRSISSDEKSRMWVLLVIDILTVGLYAEPALYHTFQNIFLEACKNWDKTDEKFRINRIESSASTTPLLRIDTSSETIQKFVHASKLTKNEAYIILAVYLDEIGQRLDNRVVF